MPGGIETSKRASPAWEARAPKTSGRIIGTTIEP